MTHSVQETADLLRAVLADLAPVVGAIAPDQLQRPTPCSEWDVEQLRDHIVGWLTIFAAGFADPNGQAPRADLEGFKVSHDPAAEVRAAADTMDRALRAGAADRPLRLGTNSMPGELALGMILWEYQMHGWDLARATGQPWLPPPAAAQASLVFAPGMLSADYQGQGKAFADRVQVDPDAPPLDRLLGLSGRDPRWQPRS
ncbi:MAG: TIGR03086 family protein [Chloroflexi bacterium]|nr:TIGR03086 family protein [Chloroflexota bacterium]